MKDRSTPCASQVAISKTAPETMLAKHHDHPQTWCGCVACVLVEALPVHLVRAWDRTYRRSVLGNHPWAGNETFQSTLLRPRTRQPE
jgi:hypothetical protein